MLRKYEDEQLVFRSATTMVRRAVWVETGESVILKSSSSEFPSENERAQLQHEYEILRSLDSAHVPTVVALLGEESKLVLVLEDLGDRDLRGLMNERGPLSLHSFLPLALTLTQVVRSVHAAEVVHRRICPANIIMRGDRGALALVDFSQATRSDQSEAGVPGPAGALGYLAPEQTGRMKRNPDSRSDLYALGAVFYEMLAGKAAIRAEDPASMIHAIIARTPQPLSELRPDLPLQLATLIDKLLAKAMEDRYQSAAGLLHDLERLASGEVTDFSLGERDFFTSSFTLSKRLYGRQEELELLAGAFERARARGLELLTLVGTSGIGKSALVDHLYRTQIAPADGVHFMEGKFPQFQRAPRSAIIKATRSFIHRLMIQPDATLRAWKSQLQASLGGRAKWLIEEVPELEWLIGEQPEQQSTISDKRVWLENLWRTLLQALAASAEALVIFLDDLQWADIASLELLESLVLESGADNILLVAAYRGDEVDETHPLSRVLTGLERGGARPVELQLQPLSRDAVRAYVSNTLGQSSDEVDELAGMIARRTEGNPLFIGEYLTFLHESGELRRDKVGRYEWTLERIHGLRATDNIARLLAARISRLPELARMLLSTCACLGSSFELDTLELAWTATREELESSLQLAIGEGLISPDSGRGSAPPRVPGEPQRPPSFRFVHDRIQQSAYELLSELERQKLHRRLAHQLSRGPRARVDERLLEIVRHYDNCIDVTADEDTEHLAALYAAAGFRAQAAGSYELARVWLRRARSLHGSVDFEARPELLPLYTQGAELARISLDFSAMHSLVSEVKSRASLLAQLPAHETLVQYHVSRGEFVEAVAIARALLEELGRPLPGSASSERLSAELEATIAIVEDHGIDELVSLPRMHDPSAIAVMRLMAQILVPVYISSPDLHPILACTMVQMSVEYGNTAESSWGYEIFGAALAILLGRYELGYRIGNSALALVNHPTQIEVLPRNYATFYTSLIHWKQPAKQSLQPLEHARRIAMEVGDIAFACVNAFNRSWNVLLTGEPLSLARDEFERCLALFERYKSEYQIVGTRALLQLVRELSEGPMQPPLVVDDEDTIATLEATRNYTSMLLLRFSQGARAYFFGDMRAAFEWFELARSYESGAVGTLMWTELTYFHSLAILAHLGASAPAQTAETLRDNRAQLSTWAKHAPENFAHKRLLVEAEFARAHEDHIQALQHYEQATFHARENGFMYDVALALERAARLELELELERSGWRRLRDAEQAYRSWGALVKADALQLELRGKFGSSGSGGEWKHRSLDFSTIFRATRALSEEIVLEALIDQLVRLLLENVAAQRAFLLMEREGSLFVEASASVDDDAPARIVLEDHPQISTAVVRYVARTRESVVLHDAAREGLFTSDPLIAARRPKSVLCVPVVERQQITGIVYLENNLATRAFTEERIETVRILLAQATLSIANARLYGGLEESNRQLEEYSRTLEERVALRTRELQANNTELHLTLTKLRETQQRLVTQQKLASLGSLTAGVAHELRNPLNFIINFAEATSEMTEDLVEFRFGSDDDFLSTTELLKSNLARISSHGLRANEVISSMLTHSQKLTSESIVFEELELTRMIRGALDFMRESIRCQPARHFPQVHTNFDPDLGEVRVASSEFSQVLINVLANACDAMDQVHGDNPQAMRLELTTAVCGDTVEIRVADNGPGVPEQLREKIFEPFFTTKPPGKGTGLGLSLSHDIVAGVHQGSLRVEARVGGGATFVISLPYAGRR